MSEIKLEAILSQPANFALREVANNTRPRIAAGVAPALGPLAAFAGTFAGSGFNTIFRPDSLKTPTPLPHPVTGSDNVLELNLTAETLSFSSSLGSVPNRGTGEQPDAFLNGVPYLQTINDVTVPNQPTGIHFEPGMWIIVPPTTDPVVTTPTLARMASIPHGTTIVAQGSFSTSAGKPTIAAIDITPFKIGNPAEKIPFPSQTATNSETARIPQDLSSFIAAGTITQAMLTDPNTVLRNHIASQTILSTTTLVISTQPATPLFGGGADNIAFLLGDAAAANPNANAISMKAVFWIETVEHILTVPVFKLGQPALTLAAETGEAGQPVPKFLVHPPIEIPQPRKIKILSTQIQYSQEVILNFRGLSWPHVSVATLVPSGPIPVPASVWG